MVFRFGYPWPLRVPRLIRLVTVNGVPVFLHWSVPLLVVFFLVASIDRPLYALVGIASYLLVLVIHELGHQFIATRLGYRVIAVEIYAIHGLCRFDHPETRLESAKIAWGGVIGQLLLAVPAVIRLIVWGYSNFGPLNAALAICGPTSMAIGLFNLLPVKPMDGATAWSLFPLLWSRRKHVERSADKSALRIFQELAEKKRKRR